MEQFELFSEVEIPVSSGLIQSLPFGQLELFETSMSLGCPEEMIPWECAAPVIYTRDSVQQRLESLADEYNDYYEYEPDDRPLHRKFRNSTRYEEGIQVDGKRRSKPRQTRREYLLALHESGEVRSPYKED